VKYVVNINIIHAFRHDVTNATRDLIKDSTQDLKSLSMYQPLDSKKSVRLNIITQTIHTSNTLTRDNVD
jgi:hypothetical protein